MAVPKPKHNPVSFTRDFNEATVTWRFDTNEEADAFAAAVAELLK